MDQLARSLLEKLLSDAEKSAAGRRIRPATLTKSNLAEYQSFRSLQAKESFETFMQAARAVNAISFIVGNRGAEEGFIQRVNVVDSRALSAFLGQVPAEDLLANAKERLLPLAERFPVLKEVLQRWAQLRTVRTFTAADAQDWVDAVRVIDFAQENLSPDVVSMPINEASGKLFKDTKRIKKLAAPIDVLLTGDVDAESREPSEVWAEIKLFREEHPVRMAGNVIVERERVSAYLDAPYTGLPADSIRRLVSTPSLVITIENQTTFHSEARRRCHDDVLLIFTSGMPNPPWRSMYTRILKDIPPDVPVFHWGDIDQGGFRIAAVIAKEASKAGHAIKPWPSMHPDSVPEELRSPASEHTISRMVHFAESAGWTALAEAIAKAKFTVEQESLA
jgi:hypothetical protein